MFVSTKRDQSIDLIRTLACISIVLMHTVCIFWYKVPVKMLTKSEYQLELKSYIIDYDINPFMSSGWYICSFLDAITRFSVPCFVMISGALILTRGSIPLSYLKKKSFYVIKLILGWGTIQAIILFTINIFTNESQSLSYYFQTIINGCGVFWFLYMLWALYVGSPIFASILKNPDATKIFIILWFLFTICLEMIKSIFPPLNTNIKFSYLGLFPSYSGYFFLGGYIMSNWKIWYDVLSKYKHAFFILALLMVIIISWGLPPGLFHNFLTPFCVVYSVCFFILLKQASFSPRLSEMIQSFAKYSMSIYALHPCILILTQRFWKPSISVWSIQLPVYFVITIFISLGISILVKKLPIIRSL